MADSSGNTATVIRRVVIREDITPPVITLVGQATVTLNIGDTYDDEGATAEDNKDGVLTPFIDDGGSIEAVDTTKAGTYVITYDVADQEGNKAEQVIRTVIVKELITDEFELWATSAGLANLEADQQTPEADPDSDGIPNLLEYAFGGKPTTADRTVSLPKLETSDGKLVLTFYRLKTSLDANLKFEPQVTNSLSGTWETEGISVKGALEGVPQDDLPDGKSFADSDYERIEASASITGQSNSSELSQSLVQN